MPQMIPMVSSEFLQRMFANVPVLIDVVGPDGFIKYVNVCWEETLGWTQEEIAKHQPDIFQECFPDSEERRRALDFVFGSDGQDAEFELRARNGRIIPMTWSEFRLPGGGVLGVGVPERDRNLVRQETDYIQRLFAPGPGLYPETRLISVESQGDETTLQVLFRDKRLSVHVPTELVKLSAMYSSADLLFRIVRSQIVRGSHEGA